LNLFKQGDNQREKKFFGTVLSIIKQGVYRVYILKIR